MKNERIRKVKAHLFQHRDVRRLLVAHLFKRSNVASLLTSHLFETADALVCLLKLTAQHLVALLHTLADLSLALNFALDCLNVILCHSSISQAHLLVVD